MKEESKMKTPVLKNGEIQKSHVTYFEVGFFADGIWLPYEKAWDYEEALEKQARLAYSHQRDWGICQVDIKTTKKKID